MQQIADDILAGKKSEQEIVDAIEAQLKLGGDVDEEIQGGEDYRGTLLCVACAMEMPKVVKTLLRRGASPNYLDSNDEQPLQLVLNDPTSLYDEERLAIIEALLIANADVNCPDSSVMSPLSIAAQQGFASIVQELLREKVNIDRGIKNAGSPLALAAMNGHEEVRRLLLEAGADVEGGTATPRIDGRTPLLLACENGFVKVAKLLLENGAAITAQDKLERTALHCAAASGSVDCLKLLLDKNLELDLDERDLTGRTPLDLAIINLRFDAVGFLLDRGKFEVTHSAIVLVTNTRHLGLFKIVLERIDPQLSDLHVVVNADYIDGLEFLLQTVESFDCTKQQLQQLIDKVAKSEEAKELLKDRIENSDDDGNLMNMKKQDDELAEVKIEVIEEESNNQSAGSRRQRSSSETESNKTKPENSAEVKQEK